MTTKNQSSARRHHWRTIVGISPVLMLALTVFATSRTVADPTSGLGKEWLNVSPAANPLAYHEPYRDGASLLYISARKNVPVRAAMGGIIEFGGVGDLKLSNKDSFGRTITVYYHGLNAIAVENMQRVECKGVLGTITINQRIAPKAFLEVSATLDGAPILPPIELKPYFTGFLFGKQAGKSHPFGDSRQSTDPLPRSQIQ